MSLEFLIPINEAHAIQSVVFALEWQGLLSDNALTDIENLSLTLKSHFPVSAVQKMRTFQFNATPDSASLNQQFGEEQVHGVTFQRVGKFGTIVSQLNVTRSNCIVLLHTYERWKPTLEAVMRYFKIVLPVILKEKSISNVTLQYEDVFTWKDDASKLNLREVFKGDSPYLAPNIFDQQGLWHCHHGYIIESLEDIQAKCLDNINVSLVDNQNDREIRISTTHQVTLSSPLRMATKDYLQSIKKVQNILHDHNKEILGKLLTEEVCAKIKLEG
jgi:uncharacterized protein (TIGR04255 family)